MNLIGIDRAVIKELVSVKSCVEVEATYGETAAVEADGCGKDTALVAWKRSATLDGCRTGTE